MIPQSPQFERKITFSVGFNSNFAFKIKFG